MAKLYSTSQFSRDFEQIVKMHNRLKTKVERKIAYTRSTSGFNRFNRDRTKLYSAESRDFIKFKTLHRSAFQPIATPPGAIYPNQAVQLSLLRPPLENSWSTSFPANRPLINQLINPRTSGHKYNPLPLVYYREIDLEKTRFDIKYQRFYLLIETWWTNHLVHE